MHSDASETPNIPSDSDFEILCGSLATSLASIGGFAVGYVPDVIDHQVCWSACIVRELSSCFLQSGLCFGLVLMTRFALLDWHRSDRRVGVGVGLI